MLIKIAGKKRERSFRELSRRDLIKLPTKQNQLKRQYMIIRLLRIPKTSLYLEYTNMIMWCDVACFIIIMKIV